LSNSKRDYIKYTPDVNFCDVPFYGAFASLIAGMKKDSINTLRICINFFKGHKDELPSWMK